MEFIAVSFPLILLETILPPNLSVDNAASTQ